jgi:hypothetical protein
MQGRMTLSLWTLGLVAASLFGRPGEVRGETVGGLQCIWSNEGNPRIQAPAGTRYFRRVYGFVVTGGMERRMGI